MKISKREFVGALLLCAGISVASNDTPAHAPAPAAVADTHAIAPASAVSPDEALKRLIEGNQRYLSQLSNRAHADQARRCDTFANGQHPFAVVLSCADSRAPVELMFDQGIGDLFVVRVAGNVADTDEIGTIEYGAGHLNAPLVVVLGHTKCGAVTAVVKGAKVSENIAKLVDNIVPAVEHANHDHPELSGDALVPTAIEANVMQSMQDLLAHSEEMRHLVSAGKVKVVGGVYDLHNGTIQWLGEHPKQSELLKGSVAAAGAGHDTHEPSVAHDAHAAPVPNRGKDAKGGHEPSSQDAHGSTDAHGATSSHERSTAHGESTSKADGPTMPHQSGTLSGMLIPAAFLGGAGLVSTSIFFRMKGRGASETPTHNDGH